MRDTSMTCTPARGTPMRGTLMRGTPMRGASMRGYAYEGYAYESHAHGMHAYEKHAHEGFCEYLARQITAAHLFQLQLGFRCRRIWVSSFYVVTHGFQSPS